MKILCRQSAEAHDNNYLKGQMQERVLNYKVLSTSPRSSYRLLGDSYLCSRNRLDYVESS